MELLTRDASPEQDWIVKRVFNIVIKDLGIADKNFTVALKFKQGTLFENEGPMSSASGSTDANVRLRGFPPKHVIRVLLDGSMGIKELVFAWVHEMIHVAQIVKGRLSQKGDKVTWEGHQLDGKALLLGMGLEGEKFYRSIPWEREAWAQGGPLYQKVKEALAHETEIQGDAKL